MCALPIWPDVRSIVHTHPPYISALSMLGEELAISHMDTSMFYEDCAWLPHWPGVPIGDEEGELISTALGGKRSSLLAPPGPPVARGTPRTRGLWGKRVSVRVDRGG